MIVAGPHSARGRACSQASPRSTKNTTKKVKYFLNENNLNKSNTYFEQSKATKCLNCLWTGNKNNYANESTVASQDLVP